MITAQPVADANPLVAADPFRAQLAFLINAGAVSVEVIAELADLDHDQLHPLLRPLGRGGSDHIPAEVARRLITISAATLRATRYELVPAGPVRSGIRRLLRAGWTIDRLIDYLKMRRPTIQLLLAGRALSCTRLTQLRVAAAIRPLPESEPVEDESRPTEARPTSDEQTLRPVA